MIKLVLVVAIAYGALALAVEKRQVGTRPTPQPGPVIRILSFKSEIEPEGKYEWSYESENGISAEESGQPTGPGEDAGTAAQGSYQYTNPEGQLIQIQYVANENGFQPVGDSIPTPPAIPSEIAKALEYNAAHPEQDTQSTQRSVAPSSNSQYSPIGVYSLG